MKKGSTTKFRLRAKSPPKTDWRAFDAMSEEERHAAALSDPDCPPATEAQLGRARRLSAHLERAGPAPAEPPSLADYLDRRRRQLGAPPRSWHRTRASPSSAGSSHAA